MNHSNTDQLSSGSLVLGSTTYSSIEKLIGNLPVEDRSVSAESPETFIRGSLLRIEPELGDYVKLAPEPLSAGTMTGMNPTPNDANRSERTREYRKLLSFYIFEDSSALKSALAQHRSASEILLEAVPHLRRCFGEDAILQIDVVWDDYIGTIYANVRWPDELGDAIERLEQFDNSWWMANAQKGSGKVVFDFELV